MFEFGIGEAVPLSEQDGFEHGQQGIGGTAAVISEVTGFLTIQVLLDRLPINHLSNFNSGKRSMCLAIMACAVCWKKVLMRNPLNVFVGI